MALSLRDTETELLVRTFAKQRSTSMTKAIRAAIVEAMANDAVRHEAEFQRKMAAIKEIQERYAKLPVLDPTVNADDWMYDENGLPH
jgi:hypothetical protein